MTRSRGLHLLANSMTCLSSECMLSSSLSSLGGRQLSCSFSLVGVSLPSVGNGFGFRHVASCVTPRHTPNDACQLLTKGFGLHDPMRDTIRRGLSSSSTAAAPTTQNLSWIFTSPVWRTVVGVPLVALNAFAALPAYLLGPQSFFKTTDRTKTVFPPVMDGLESKFVEANGLKLHVMATQAAEGKPLMLFLHGFPEFWYSWRHQLKHFSERYQVAALDMRGYNLSDKPEGVEQYTMDKIAADVSQVVRALGHQKCILVGHDWGSAVAWATAALFPEAVEKVVGLSAPPFRQFVHHMGVKQAITSYYMLIATFYPKIMEVLLSAHDFDFVKVILMQQVGMDRITRDDIERYKQALQRPGALKAALNYYTAVWSITAQDVSNPVNRRTLEEQVKQPALFLIGDKEAFVTHELLDGVEQHVPKLTVVKIPDARHFLPYERPEAVNAAIDGWLASPAASR